MSFNLAFTGYLKGILFKLGFLVYNLEITASFCYFSFDKNHHLLAQIVFHLKSWLCKIWDI